MGWASPPDTFPDWLRLARLSPAMVLAGFPADNWVCLYNRGRHPTNGAITCNCLGRPRELALFVRVSHGLVPQPRPAQRELASFVHNGITHRLCRNPAISCGELGILSAISVSLCAALTARP